MKIFIIISLSFLFLPLFAQSKETIQLEWIAVKAASAYLLEVKDEKGELIFSQKTKETSIPIELDPGSYTKRLTVFDIYENQVSSSDWIPLIVKERSGVKVKVEWTEISHAKKYILEVRDASGNLVKQKETESNYTYLRLEPGKYEKRLVVINQFGEVESEGTWSPLNVILVLSPEIEKQTQIIKNYPQKQSLIIKGKNFEKGIAAKLYSNEKEVTIQKIEVINQNMLKIDIHIQDNQTGNYSLKLKNERGKEAIAESYLTVNDANLTEKAKVAVQKWEILLRSSVAPGWGQIYAGEKYNNSNHSIRGYIYPTLFVSAILYKIYINNAFQKDVKSIQSLARTGIAAGLVVQTNEDVNYAPLVVIPSLLQKKSHAQDLSEKNEKINSLMIGVYLIQLADAFWINKSRNDKLEQSGFQMNYEKQKSLFGVNHQMQMNYFKKF